MTLNRMLPKEHLTNLELFGSYILHPRDLRDLLRDKLLLELSDYVEDALDGHVDIAAKRMQEVESTTGPS